MFTLTDAARKELDVYFEDKDTSPIRIYLAPGACAGPRLALALDDSRPGDQVFTEGGYTFCLIKELMDEAKNIRIDFDMGFVITSDMQLGGACGGCRGCSA
jgi:Fe-S cluster assembly iron-binding protein IscA